MSWHSPWAPAGEPALGLKPDSCLIRPASSAGSIPLRWAAAVISEPYGVPAGSAEAPPVAGGAGAPRSVAVPIGEARLAKLALALALALVPVAAFIAAEKAAVLSVAGAT